MPFGGDYNPEQWPEEVWSEDLDLMKRAGVNFVTVGVFSWARLQPALDRWEFGWLDRVLNLLHGAGIRVDLATATAATPPWLARAHPEMLPVDERGVRATFGSRQTWCPSSPVYREHSLALVEQMARRYGSHPALAMWHVSNELGCHNSRCYCPTSSAAFRTWLRHRYGGLAALNEAWGTTVWSQAYGDWDQIEAPATSSADRNPSQLLDFHRFSSDALLEQYRAERDVLRRWSPGVPVTTNLMVRSPFVDCFGWGPELDIVSNDHYLLGFLPDPSADLAYAADTTRGCARRQPWLLMEHSTSAVSWQPVNKAKEPGEMLRSSLTHVARGADGVAFFQWRASVVGPEKFHSAMLPHAGPDSDRFAEVCRLGRVVERLSELRGSTVDADVALLADWPSSWALDGPGKPSSLVRSGAAANAYHGALRSLGVTCDVVPPDADLGRYRLVLVPTLYLCDDATAEAIAGFASSGGHVLVTFFSGIVDVNDHVRLGGYPGGFRDLLGVTVEEFFPLDRGETVRLANGGTATLWSERCRAAEGTAVLDTYASGPVSGNAAITRRDTAWYVGTALEADDLRSLLVRVTAEAGVRPPVPLPLAPAGRSGPATFDITRRRSGEQTWLFVINRGESELSVDASGHDLVSDTTVVSPLRVAPGGCAVVRETPGR